VLGLFVTIQQRLDLLANGFVAATRSVDECRALGRGVRERLAKEGRDVFPAV
jgi:hypothetical protein